MPRFAGLLSILVLAAACSMKSVPLIAGGDDGAVSTGADGSALPPDTAPTADVTAPDGATIPDAPLPADAAAATVDAAVIADAATDRGAPEARIYPDILPDPIIPEPDAAPPPPDAAPDMAPAPADAAAPAPDLAADTAPLAPDLAPDTSPPPPDVAPDSSPAPGGNELVFVTNQNSNNLTVFVVDTVTGAHTTAPGSPFAMGDRPWDLVITPDGKFLYVGNFGSEDIRGFRVAADGRLTALPDAPDPVPMPEFLVMAPSGRALYASGPDGLLYGFAIDPASGSLQAIAGSPFAGVQAVQGLAIDPLGRFVAVVVRLDPSGNGKLRLLAIDPGSGALQPAAEAAIAGHIRGDSPALAFDPGGAFIYGAGSATGGADQIFGFAVASSGALTLIPGSPWPGANEAHSISFHPSRPLLYYGSTTDIVTLRRAASGALSEEPGSPALFNNDPDSALSSLGNFLYVLYQDDAEVTVSRIGASGLPEPFAGSPWKTGGTNPFRIIVWAAPSF